MTQCQLAEKCEMADPYLESKYILRVIIIGVDLVSTLGGSQKKKIWTPPMFHFLGGPMGGRTILDPPILDFVLR